MVVPPLRHYDSVEVPWTATIVALAVASALTGLSVVPTPVAAAPYVSTALAVWAMRAAPVGGRVRA